MFNTDVQPAAVLQIGELVELVVVRSNVPWNLPLTLVVSSSKTVVATVSASDVTYTSPVTAPSAAVSSISPLE